MQKFYKWILPIEMGILEARRVDSQWWIYPGWHDGEYWNGWWTKDMKFTQTLGERSYGTK